MQLIGFLLIRLSVSYSIQLLKFGVPQHVVSCPSCELVAIASKSTLSFMHEQGDPSVPLTAGYSANPSAVKSRYQIRNIKYVGYHNNRFQVLTPSSFFIFNNHGEMMSETQFEFEFTDFEFKESFYLLGKGILVFDTAGTSKRIELLPETLASLQYTSRGKQIVVHVELY